MENKKFANGVISVSICLSDLPKDKIKKASNGKLYIGISVREKKEVDQYGNDATAYVTHTKEEKEAAKASNTKLEKQYVGNGKIFIFSEGGVPEATDSEKDLDDLPF